MKNNYCKIAALPLLIAALTVIFSCKKDTPSEEPTLSVTNSSAVLVFSADGKTMTADGATVSPVFSVTTNQPSWNAKSDQTWLKLTKDEYQFTLAAESHMALEDLPPAKVTVTAGTAIPVILYVTQETPTAEESEYANQSLILGHGYDVTGNYAVSSEIKPAVLDFAKLLLGGMVKRDGNMQKAEFYTSSGITATEYTQSLAVHAGISTQVGVAGVGAFSSELKANYNESKTSQDAYSFATSTSRITKDAWFLENRKEPEELRQYVSAKFLSDLEIKTPEEVISKYGTHVMLGGIWGARLDYHFSAKKKLEAYTRDIGTSFSSKAEMSAKAITAGGGINLDVQNQYASNYQSETEEVYTLVYGGDPEYARSVQDSQEYDKWIASIEGNEIWCDYYPESLVPIYEFIDDEAKRADIEQAYMDYLNGKKINVTTSLQGEAIRRQFELIGATIIQGDGEINSGGHGETYWQATISLSKGTTGIIASFFYRVTEGGTSSNKSIFEMRKNVDIPVYRSDYIITSELLAWDSGVRVIAGDASQFWYSGPDTPWCGVTTWEIKVDDSGRSDHEKVGVRGTLRVPIAYYK